jgi:hypothetical protein
VFWINAKTEQSLRLSLLQVANQVRSTQGLDASSAESNENAIGDSILYVREWLCQENNYKWLLIFDNVDSQTVDDGAKDEIEEQQDAKDLVGSFDAYQYIPQVEHGSILITSRLSFLSRAFGAMAIRVDEMLVSEGISLLCKISGRRPHEPGEFAGFFPIQHCIC